MRTTNLYFPTLKEIPNEAELISHQLMLRAGMIRKLAAGLYTWMPLGLIVLRKIEHIVRQEMNAIGAQEILMPILAPANLWQETNRWEKFGPQLFTLKDRNHRPFCLGPTHEEVVTDLVRTELRSYKQLPATFYQIQTKFRDEIRPRFGVMRAREFLMKDAYSFHLTTECLAKTYKDMHSAYCKIFDRLQLKYRAIIADSGAIGGDRSQEFHVLADSGEDQLVYSDHSDYAANIEIATALTPTLQPRNIQAELPLTLVETPNITNIEDLSEFLKIKPEQTLKIMLVRGSSKTHPVIALALRGDHKLNPIKVEKLAAVAAPLEFINTAELTTINPSLTPGFIGPINLPAIPLICDPMAMALTNFVCGANQIDYHYCNANWERDCCVPAEIADLRFVCAGDPSPDGNGNLQITRGIEIGHIFQLGDHYSKMMQAKVLDPNGKSQIMPMGCYGIGVSRIVAASIEQLHDDKGIVWPKSLQPFQVAIIPINYHKSNIVKDATDNLYNKLIANNTAVLLDDRNESPGKKFKDMELIGIPHFIIISDQLLATKKLELQARDGTKQVLDTSAIIDIFND